MKKVNFILGIHCHQPVGNFEKIFYLAYEKAYKPFLTRLKAFPHIPFNLHISGPIWDWASQSMPELYDLVNEMVAKGQVELLTGGFYEPILPIIPDKDRIGQIKMMTEFLKKKFGQDARGMWLSERVWEPHLPQSLAKAGVEYTIVDDYHFKCAGMIEQDLLGYYHTEDLGCKIAIFPISEHLRYSIPFKEPHHTLALFERLASKKGDRLLVMADDGEKFGLWPGTYKWVYEDGWLDWFLKELDKNRSWVEVMKFSTYLKNFPPLGNIYLPTASYFEMSEWSLPAKTGAIFESEIQKLKGENRLESLKPFLRGGIWRNFLAKYPESYWMHKRMLYCHEQVHNYGSNNFAIIQPAIKELYKAQCNCAYWHGVFGGLYLPHLRNAIYEHFLKAENIISSNYRRDCSLCWKEREMDPQFGNAIILSNSYLNLFIFPNRNGSIREIDLKKHHHNLCNILNRREESYHNKILTSSDSNSPSTEASHTSIHEIDRSKASWVKDFLLYDKNPHLMLTEYFFKSFSDVDRFIRGEELEFDPVQTINYQFCIEQKEQEIDLIMDNEFELVFSEDKIPIKINKNIALYSDQSLFSARFLIKPSFRHLFSRLIFALDFPFILPSASSDAVSLYFNEELSNRYSLATRCAADQIKRIEIIDGYKNIKLSFKFDQEAFVNCFPLETISQSEKGVEKNYQGSVLLPAWELSNDEDQFILNLEVLIE